MDSLNEQQKRAVQAGDGPVLIVAGPGTGKTKNLIARLQFLVANGTPAKQILALTFTKKAAQEMTARYKALAGEGGPRITTFHGFCHELLTERLGSPPQFISESARFKIIKNLARSAALKGLSARELSLRISRAKNMAGTDAEIEHVLAAYNARLQDQNLHDFDDLLLQVRDDLRADPAWQNQVQSRYKTILVDEFQDTNALQYDILRLVAAHQNLFVIGDPRQSIYGFRGADGDIFGRFRADFPGAVPVSLTTNYRSKPQIIAVANALYPQNTLKAATNQPGRVQAVEVLNEYSEAAWVLNEIQRAIGGSDLQRAVSDDERAEHKSLRHFAVLYRSRPAGRVVQQAMAESGIPLQVVGEGSPYDDSAVQTILQLLGTMVEPARTVDSLKPAQVIGVLNLVSPGKNPAQIAAILCDHFGWSQRPELRQLMAALLRFSTVEAAVDYFDALAVQDFYDPRAEAVTLLTIHASKGLEFGRVFLVGAEEGILPSVRGEIEEEKRLFYVAATRAVQELDILYTRKRAGQPAEISRFIRRLPQEVLPRIVDPALQTDARRAQKRHAKRAQATLFS